MYQYKITVNGAQGPVLNEYPALGWQAIADALEARGGHAVLYRRLVADSVDVADVTLVYGSHIKAGGKLVFRWTVFAELDL